MSNLRTLWSGFTVLLALTSFILAAQPPTQAPAGGRGPGGFGASQGLPPTYANIDYASPEPASSNGHKLDLYIPAGAAQPLPVMIWTAGSAWSADTGKSGAGIVASQLNPAGYVVAGVSIRSSAQVKFPGQLHDIKAAIRWLRTNAARYNLDPDHIAIMGDSSGGWTTAMAAVTGDAPEMEGSVGTTGVSSAVQAAVAFYPPTNFLTMDAWALRKCSPQVCHDGENSPESRLVGCPIQSCSEKLKAASPMTYINSGRSAHHDPARRFRPVGAAQPGRASFTWPSTKPARTPSSSASPKRRTAIGTDF